MWNATIRMEAPETITRASAGRLIEKGKMQAGVPFSLGERKKGHDVTGGYVTLRTVTRNGY